MVKKYFTKYISSFLTDYIHDLNENTIEVGLLSGTLKLENLSLKTENFQKYFHYNIKSIKIKHIVLRCSFLSLLYKPIEIFVKGITVELEKRIIFEKNNFIFEKIKFLEEETNKMVKKKSVSKILLKVFEKASVKFEDIHINLSDEDTKDKYVMKIGTLQSLSVDENWEENLGVENDDMFYKIFEILQTKFVLNNIDIFDMCDLKCKLVVRKNNFTDELPDVNVDLQIPKVKVNISLRDYKKMIDLINCYIMQKKMRFNIMDNINYIDIYNKKIPMHSLMKKFIDYKPVILENECQLDTEQPNNHYKTLYSKLLTNKLDTEETNLLNKYEEVNSAKIILKIREQVLTEKKLQPKRRFFFWTSTISEEEKNKLLSNLEIDDVEHKITTCYCTFQLKKLILNVHDKKKSFSLLSSNIFTKYNSIQNIFQSTLSKLTITCNNELIIKSNKETDVFKLLYINDKINIHVNDFRLSRLYEFEPLIIKLRKYKIHSFEPEIVKSNIDKASVLFDVKIEKARYIISKEKLVSSIAEMNIIGSCEAFDVDLYQASIYGEEGKIFNTNSAYLNYKIIDQIISLHAKIEKTDIDLTIFSNFADNIFEEMHNYQLETKTKPKKSVYKLYTNLEIANFTVSPQLLNARNFKLSIDDKQSQISSEEILSIGLKTSDLTIYIKDGMLLNSLEIYLDLVKLKNNRSLAFFHEFTLHYDKFHSKMACKSDKKESNSNAFKMLISHANIYIKHYEKDYKLSAHEVKQSGCKNIQFRSDGTEITICNVNCATKNIIIENITACKNFDTVYILAEILGMFKSINALPLNNDPRTTEFSITINKTLLIDNNHTKYRQLEMFSDSIKVDFHLNSIVCILDLNISEKTHNNTLKLDLGLTKQAEGITGNTILTGRIDSEFYKSIFYNFNVTFDIIGHVVNNLFSENYKQSIVDWMIEADVDLYNYKNQEFLIRLIGSVPVNCALTNTYEKNNFSNDGNYLYDRNISMASHSAIQTTTEIYYGLQKISACNISIDNDITKQGKFVTYNCITINLENIKGYNNHGFHSKCTKSDLKSSREDTKENIQYKNDAILGSEKFVKQTEKNEISIDDESYENADIINIRTDSTDKHGVNTSDKINQENNEMKVSKDELMNINNIDDHDLCAFLNKGTVKIYKHMYGMSINIQLKQVICLLKFYKLLMIRHNFITPNLSLNIPGISQEIVVNVNLDKMIYKNIGIENFVFAKNNITMEINTIDEFANYKHRLNHCNKKGLLQLAKNHNYKNLLLVNSYLYINVSNELEGLTLYIKVHGVHLIHGEKYMELKAMFDRILEDNTIFNENVIFDNERFTKIFIQGDSCKAEVNDQYILNVKHFKIENEATINGILYKGTSTVDIKTFNNNVIEPYVYHFEYINNNLTINGSQTLRAVISKDFLHEKIEFNAQIINYTNVPCEVFYNEEIFDISQPIMIKSKDNLPLVFKFDSKNGALLAKVYPETKTYQIVIDDFLYIIDVSIKNMKLKIRIFSNIIFKNYTEYEMTVLIGDDNVKDKKSSSLHELSKTENQNIKCDELKLKPFEDACFCPQSKHSLFCKLIVEGLKEYPDNMYFYDGIDNCENKTHEVVSYGKTKFTFDKDNIFIFLNADLIVAKCDGYKTFYVLLYPEHFLYNATNRAFDLTFINMTHKIDKQFRIESITIDNDSSSTRFADKENLDTYDSLNNIISLPYSTGSDKVSLAYRDYHKVQREIDTKSKDGEDNYIKFNNIEKYGIYYEQKERTLHSLPYMSSMHEIIIYPYYVIDNELDYPINIGSILINRGQNMINLPRKNDKIIIDKNYTSKNEINFNSVELFSVLKIKCKGYEPVDSDDLYTHRDIFGITSVKNIKKEEKVKNKKNDIKLNKNSDISKSIGVNKEITEYFDLTEHGYYKNIAIEMYFGTGKYKNSRIVKINNANVLINNTKYNFFAFVATKGYRLKAGTKTDIHFGDIEAFYIFYNDPYGLEDLGPEKDKAEKYHYFGIQDAYFRMKDCHYSLFNESCCYVPINNISSKYFCLMRTVPVLFKLRIAIKGKQRILDITESLIWPIMIKNKTKYIAKVKQIGGERDFYINPGNHLDFCYECLHLKKNLSISVGKTNINFKESVTSKSKDNFKVFSMDKEKQNTIEIIDTNTVNEDILLQDLDNYKFMKINIFISTLAISFFNKKEFICIHAKNLELEVKRYIEHDENLIKYKLTADSLQIDDQNVASKFPIILHPKNRDLNFLSKKKNINDNGEFIKIHLETTDCIVKDNDNIMDVQKNNSVIKDENQVKRNNGYYSKKIDLFSFAMQEFYLQIDENMLNLFIDMFKDDVKQKFILQCNDCEKIKCECISKSVAVKKNIKVGTLHIHPIVFKFSFKKSGKIGGLYNKLIKQLIANVSDYKISLNAELLHDVDNPLESIQDIIINHYKSQLFKNIFHVLGSLDLLGNFGSFTDTFSIGVKDLFYEPLLGIKEDDPKKFSLGLLKGGKSLVKHTVSGLSGMLSKFSRGVSKNISVATFDKKFQDYNVNTIGEYQHETNLNTPNSFCLPHSSLKPMQRGISRFVDSVSSGMSGFVEQPMEGATTSGVKGFFKGVGKGAIGLVTKPVVGLVDMAGGVADGIKTGLDGTKLCRIQFPRHKANETYDYGQASAYFIYLKFKAKSDLKFVYGETYNNNHFILTNEVLFIYSKDDEAEIKINNINIVDQTIFHERRRYKISLRMKKVLDAYT